MAFSFLRDLETFRRAPSPFLLQVQRQEGDLVFKRLGLKRFAFLFHPSLAQTVLRDSASFYRKAPYLFEQMEPIIGKSALVRLEGER